MSGPTWDRPVFARGPKETSRAKARLGDALPGLPMPSSPASDPELCLRPRSKLQAGDRPQLSASELRRTVGSPCRRCRTLAPRLRNSGLPRLCPPGKPGMPGCRGWPGGWVRRPAPVTGLRPPARCRGSVRQGQPPKSRCSRSECLRGRLLALLLRSPLPAERRTSLQRTAP